MIQKLRSLIENGVTTVNDAPVTVAFDYMATGMAYGDDDFFGEDEDFLEEEGFDDHGADNGFDEVVTELESNEKMDKEKESSEKSMALGVSEGTYLHRYRCFKT